MPEEEWLPIARERAINIIMADIRNDLMRLNVIPDVFYSERSLIEGEEEDPFAPAPAVDRPKDVVAGTIDVLRAKGLVYEGRLPPPKERRASRTGRTASRRCSAPPISATTSTGRC